MVKHCTMCLEYQQTQSHEKALHYEIPYRAWGVGGAHVFVSNCNPLLSIVDYHSKFPIVKKVDSKKKTDNLLQMNRLILQNMDF